MQRQFSAAPRDAYTRPTTSGTRGDGDLMIFDESEEGQLWVASGKVGIEGRSNFMAY
jgi:hypothetical protein